MKSFAAVLFVVCSSFFLSFQSQESVNLTRGDTLFNKHCTSCHALHDVVIGPKLAGITDKYDRDWLADFVTDGMKMVKAGDTLAVKTFNAHYKVVHPDFSKVLSKDDVSSILLHLATKSPKVKPNIDALKASPKNFRLLMENEYVRVLEYVLNPGEKDEWHTHPPKSSYVVAGGKLKVQLANGETIIADEQTNTASWMDYVGKHYVQNIGATPVKIILTEIKSLGK